jgi:polar amino acid transport system substrate-binding protein
MNGRVRVLSALVAALGLGGLTACAPADKPASQASSPSGTSSAVNQCSKDKLHLFSPGKLTIGTDKPAYDPWFKDNNPANGQGFESAVAYAVADKLGFTKDEVTWTTVPFNSSYAPGPKKFDFDINQISINADRKKAVDFSDGYYTVNQAVIVLNGSKYASAKSVADLKTAKLGAQVGTTSLDAIKNVVAPTTKPAVFNDTNDAKNALINKQVDGIVADLPTAFYLTAAEIDNSKIAGQFPTQGEAEQFGLLFEKGNPLVSCVNTALGALKSSGELQQITDQWLAQAGGAPNLT